MNIGIDVSKHQGAIDYNALKKSNKVSFCIIRAGYGRLASQKDSQLVNNINGCKNNNIPYGFYWYSYAMSVEEAKLEANVMLSTIKGYNPDYPVFFDLEDPSQTKLGKKTLTDMAIAFLGIIKAAGYSKVGLYTNPNWMKNYIDIGVIKKYGYYVWMAKYSKQTPDTTNYSAQCDIWQYASNGKVNGINGNVDMNVCYTNFVSENSIVSFKCDTPKLNIVEGNSYQYRITANTKPNVVVARKDLINLEFVSQDKSDYFYKVTAIGKAPNAIGLYVDGKRVSVITINPVTSDTHGNFKIKQKQIYQFATNTTKVVSGNVHAAKLINQKFINGVYYTKFQMIGNIGDKVGFYIGNQSSPTAVCEII